MTNHIAVWIVQADVVVLVELSVWCFECAGDFKSTVAAEVEEDDAVAGDIYAGPLFQTDMWKYVRINFSFGPHFLYELSDQYHHLELGGGTLLGVELPVAAHWSILLNGLTSLDYRNLGTNKIIAPYNIVWNYQLELGFRFSKRNKNEFSYIRQKPKN